MYEQIVSGIFNPTFLATIAFALFYFHMEKKILRTKIELNSEFTELATLTTSLIILRTEIQESSLKNGYQNETVLVELIRALIFDMERKGDKEISGELRSSIKFFIEKRNSEADILNERFETVTSLTEVLIEFFKKRSEDNELGSKISKHQVPPHSDADDQKSIMPSRSA